MADADLPSLLVGRRALREWCITNGREKFLVEPLIRGKYPSAAVAGECTVSMIHTVLAGALHGCRVSRLDDVLAGGGPAKV